MGLRFTTEQVAKTRLFEGFTLDEVKDLLSTSNMLVKHCTKGDYIYLAGDVIDSLCLVVVGTVQVIREDILGDKSIVANVEAGRTFGENNLALRGTPSRVSYLAAEDCDLLLLPLSRMTLLNIGNPDLFSKYMINIVGIIAEHNERLISKVDILGKKTLRSKIMTYLEMTAGIRQTSVFDLPFNRTELASYLDADRSAMTRELFRMKKEGIIDFKKNTFTILKHQE